MTTCPKCRAEFETHGGVCPECGVRLRRHVSGIVKTSVVMISADGEDALYSSVQEIPERLRKRLMETTTGDNSGTIVIADRAGKEQLTQVLSRREAKREMSLPDSAVVRRRRRGISWMAWAGFLVILALAGITSVFFGLHW